MSDRPRHTCHWPGCTVEVEPQFWGCRTHWYRLPKPIRSDIWRHYRRGQEIDKDPSREYVAAAARARKWIYDHHPEAVPVALVQPLERLRQSLHARLGVR
jgi:hypothetical protein